LLNSDTLRRACEMSLFGNRNEISEMEHFHAEIFING